MAFTCKLHIDIPREIRAGVPMKATVKVSEANAPVKAVVASLDGYGFRQNLKQLDADTFGLSFTIPFIAPRGNYKIIVWALSQSGERSESTTVQVTLR